MNYLNKRTVEVQAFIDFINSQVLYQIDMEKGVPELREYFTDLRENLKTRKEELILLKGLKK
jgi:hypothetical protein